MVRLVGFALFLLVMLLTSCSTQYSDPVESPLVHDGHPVENSTAEVFTLPLPSVSQQPTHTLSLPNGTTFQLRAGVLTWNLGKTIIPGLSYNFQIPGPTLRVKQGSTVFVNFTNNIRMPSTIHWHGIRVLEAYDGVSHRHGGLVQHGESFLYELTFPDTGIYWYHPHYREDIQQDLGLYGNILVEPLEEVVIPPEQFLMLDDLLIVNHSTLPYYTGYATHALMGRFGNVMITNGVESESYHINATQGFLRLYVTNAAGSRTFDLSLLPSAPMQWIGSDGGTFQSPVLSENIVLAPSERATIDVLLGPSDTYRIVHTSPAGTSVMATIDVLGRSGSISEAAFTTPKISLPPQHIIDAEPVFEFELTSDMGSMGIGGMHHGGMMQPEPVEWEDPNPAANAASTSDSTTWKITDAKTGLSGDDLVVNVSLGSYQKIRLVNPTMQPHAMQHPIHIHGQRFLVTAIDLKRNPNLSWKDTVLVPAGSTVDVLVEFSNPGEWLIHCHIPEHMESGMMARFVVS